MQNEDMIKSGTLAPYFRLLKNGGASIEPILHRLNLSSEVAIDLSLMIPRAAIYSLTAEVARQTGIIEFGALAGRELNLNELGPIGRGVLSAVTLHAAGIAASQAASQTANTGQCWIELRSGYAWFCYRAATQVQGEDSQAELYKLMMLIQFVRMAAHDNWCPERIRVYASPPEIVRQVDEFSNAEIVLDKDTTAVAFPPSWMGLRIAAANVQGPIGQNTSYTETIQNLLHSILPYSGSPDLATTAEMLSMEPRTLQRALSAEGSQYRGLVEHANYHHAAELLTRHPEMPLKEIAFRLGYSGINNFTRAFKRIAGVAPGGFRKVNLA